MYILINSYRWDWLMLLVITISDLFVFFWTGVFTAFTSSGVFYHAAPEVYGEATFWAVVFLTPVVCLFPRYAIKAVQKVYKPYDVDIIREQVQQGKFDRLAPVVEPPEKQLEATGSGSSDLSKKGKHAQYPSEDRRPIYPPSVATHNTHAQNGSDGTNYTQHQRPSEEIPEEMPDVPVRPSMDRVRPSYDRMRASMDRVRASYEASNDFTTAARLTRIESSHSGHSHPHHSANRGQGSSRNFMQARLRGLSIISNKSKH
jgi:phospholipid-translocating ATPase